MFTLADSAEHIADLNLPAAVLQDRYAFQPVAYDFALCAHSRITSAVLLHLEVARLICIWTERSCDGTTNAAPSANVVVKSPGTMCVEQFPCQPPSTPCPFVSTMLHAAFHAVTVNINAGSGLLLKVHCWHPLRTGCDVGPHVFRQPVTNF